MSAALVEARGVGRTLPGEHPVVLVRDIDMAVHPGEFVAITGPSGSGKSSLLYLLGLLDRPTEGTVAVEGRDTSALSQRELARIRLEKIGFVFQFHFLLPEFTCLGNLMIPMRKLARRSERGMRAHAEHLLDSLGLAGERHKRPDQLSGGQRQRVAIARALANEPPILLADEPTGNLDTANARNVFAIFERLARAEGKAVVTVTHDAELAARAQRRIHLIDGRIVSDAAQPPPADKAIAVGTAAD